MTWKKGQSGNPAGRVKKPRATGEQQLRADLLAKAPEIIAALEVKAAEGDVGAAKILLDRCLPPLRATEAPVPIPLGDLSAATQRILEALESGVINLDQGAKLAAIVGTLTRSAEAADFERRLATLESANAKP